MANPALRILGNGQSSVEENASFADWARAVGPIIAPFAILACAARSEMLLVALVWAVFMIPGLLAANLLFGPEHPLGRGVARLGLASVLAMFPFSVLSWTGCMVHWRLSTVLVLYAIVYVAIVAIAAVLLLRRGRRGESGKSKEATPDSAGEKSAWPVLPLTADAPRWTAVVTLVGIVVVMVGVCMAAPPLAEERVRFNPQARPDWWHGVLVGAIGSLVAAAGLVLGYVRRTREAADEAVASAAGEAQTKHAENTTRSKGKSKTKRRGARDSVARPAFGGVNLQVLLIALLWIASAAITVYIMKAAYSVSVPEMELLKRGALPWNVDDVAYVSEAVDYAAGQPMGEYEASLGSDHAMSHAAMSPLMAPLVATISRVTGVGCAALHHSVMPPLMFLVGMSCLAGALSVVFRGHRWAVALGMLIALMMILKSWDYARVVVEMIVYRAMQGKSLHLLLLHPLQLASVLLVLHRGSWRHVGFAVAVAWVGHTIHPLATITGIVWYSAAVVLSRGNWLHVVIAAAVVWVGHTILPLTIPGMVLYSALVVITLVWWRRSLIQVVALLALSCGFAGLFYYVSHLPKDKPPPASDRVPGSPIQSRDLIRVDTLGFTLDDSFADDLESGFVTDELSQVFQQHKLYLPANMRIPFDEETGAYVVGGAQGGYRIAPVDGGFDVYETGGAPIPRHDPFWAFGCNTLYHAGALAVPIILAFGLRRREILWVGLIGAAVLLATNVTPLGKLLNMALPTSIFWRSRWMLPALVNMAIVGVVIYWSARVLLRRGTGAGGPVLAFISALIAVGMFGVMLYNSTSRLVRIGDNPVRLSKFSPDMHDLVGLLGGEDSSAFVFGPFVVQHELPQLMPNVQLVFSREKFMRTADHPQYRRIAEGAFNQLSQGTIAPDLLRLLLSVYPDIDHFVIYNRGAGARSAQALEAIGWERVGRAGIYEVWRRPDASVD